MISIDRFKVQTTIAQKQRDSQLKPTPMISLSNGSRNNINNSMGDIKLGIESKINSQNTVLEQEILKWKSAYESAVAENEHLRSRGEEANQASHWRERFETCERERNEALDKLRSVLDINSGNNSSTGHTDFNALKQDLLGSGAIYQKYLALKEEFEVKCYHYVS